MFRITLERLPLRVDFEAGSVAEAVAILQEQDTALRQIVSLADDMAGTPNEAPTTGEATTEAPKVTKPRGRPAKNQPDPSTATAPPPVAVPPVAAPALVPATDGGIPPFLQRAPEAPAELAAPPPPPAPPAPPAAPVVPPSGILAGKVIANLDQRKAATPDGGKALADWLAQCGLVTAGASYDEAVAVVRMTADDKLTAIAGHLGVAA